MVKQIHKLKFENYRIPLVREFMCSFHDECVKPCATVKTKMPMA